MRGFFVPQVGGNMLITKELIKLINKRDKYTCKKCEGSDNVGISIITPRYGYTIENVLLLCKYCNKYAAYYWKSNCRDYVEGFHPDDLYKLIDSNRNRAMESRKNEET